MADDLINSIYEAAAIPTLWPQVLHALSTRVNGNGSVLFGVREGYVKAIASPTQADAIKSFMTDGWSERDPALKRAMVLNHPGFLNDADLLTDEERAVDEVYCNFYREHGMSYRAGTLIPNPSGDSIAIVTLRHENNGPVPRETVAFLDTLRPHLARASMLAFRIGFEQARAQAAALQAVGLPAAVLRPSGAVLASNPLFEALVPVVMQDRRGRVMLTNGSADTLLEQAIARYRAGSVAVTPASIPIPAFEDRLAMIAHLLPVRGAAHDVFSQSAMLLIVTPVDRSAVPTAEVLQGLFDLTPAEARVARGIGLAQSVEALAASQGVSRETIRSQLKLVLAKTGLNRQVELVSLLAGLPAAR